MTSAERYDFAFTQALEAAVAMIDTTDETDAAAQVSQALSDAKAEGIKAVAVAVVVESRGRARDAAREAQKAKADADRRERVERDGRAALTKVFGKMADKVAESIFESWTVVEVIEGELVLALPTRELDEFRTGVRSGQLDPGYERKSVPGYQLAKACTPADLDAVCSTADEAFDIVRAAHAAALEADRGDRERRAEEAQLVRERAEQERTYGTTV